VGQDRGAERVIPDFIRNAGHELPFILLLIALLGFRSRVTPRAHVFIKATPDKVFQLVDFTEGQNQRWQRTRVTSTLVDPATRTYKLNFVTPLAAGAVQSSEALFRVARRDTPSYLEIDRAGLEGKSTNNQLLKMTATLEPRDGGTDLTFTYYWGPRPLLAQLLARADLWGSVYRLKGLAETGAPDYRTDALISALVALVTGVVSLYTFVFAFGWLIAALLVVCLLIHEFGHLLAYRLIGQPWGRLVFLPFLGAIAVPRLGFTTQGQIVFAAIMGPAFSVIVPLVAAAWVWAGGAWPDIAVMMAIVACGLNLFNLLPVEPLDGGIVLRSVLVRIMGGWARFGLIAAGIAIVAAGFAIEQVLLVIFGALAFIMNFRRRTIDHGLEPMSRLAVSISAFAFMSVVAAYAVLLRHFMTFT
jgi:Zn-dependent protease